LYSVQTRLETPTTTQQKDVYKLVHLKTQKQISKPRTREKKTKLCFQFLSFGWYLFLFFPLIVFLQNKKVHFFTLPHLSSTIHIDMCIYHQYIYIYIYIYIPIYSNNPSYLFCFWLSIWELKLQRLNLSCPPLNFICLFIYFSNFRCCFLA